jgi:putative DNA primase/helicase
LRAAEIAKHLRGSKSGDGYVVCCPAHDDHTPSLSVRDGHDGRIVVKCHAGCEQTVVIASLKALGLWPDSERRMNKIVATYDYTTAAGNMLYQVVRFEPKDFRPRYPDGAGGWVWKKHPDQVLYHLREVLENPIIFVVEGEKDVEGLREHGFVGTTNAGGARAPWLPQFTEALRDREVILIPDNDAPGKQRVLTIARALRGHASRTIILELEDGKDVSDWFERGHSEAELVALVEDEEVRK